jgi:hypothetical protein
MIKCSNILANPILNSIPKIPEFKICAVKIQKIETTGKNISSSPSVH